VVVGFIGDQEGAVFIAAQRFGALLGQHAAQKPNIPLRILGPAPMNITMLNNKFRYKLTLKCRNDAAFRALLHETLDAYDAEKLPLEQVLPLVRQRGFTCAHLALSKSLKEVPNTPSALTPGYAAYLRRLFAQNGIDIAVLGNYLNLAHPDEDALHAIQEKYYAHIRFASLLGCGMVGTETGAPNAEYKFCPECRSDAALATFIKNFKPVVRCAEQYGVTIAIEPVVKHIVYDAKRARTVLDEIGSPNLQILLDPVNLLNMENVDAREDVFAEAIELLGKDVAMIHFKDFLRKDAGGQLAATGAGQGGMGDYRTILRFAKQEKPWVFATLENTTPENSVQCLQYLQKQYDAC